MICPIIRAGLSQNMTAEESVIAMRNRLSECLKEECAWCIQYFDEFNECALPAAARELNFLRRGIKED